MPSDDKTTDKFAEARKMAEQDDAAGYPPEGVFQTTTEAWVISVCLEADTDGVAADEWMDAIETAIFARDPGFSGTVSMRKEPVDVIEP